MAFFIIFLTHSFPVDIIQLEENEKHCFFGWKKFSSATGGEAEFDIEGIL